jgi:23S rRNA (adenine2503-C2)-methyltransferase
MRIIASTGRDDVATIYVAEFGPGEWVEFVEAVSPPFPRNKKWVLLISTLHGCPVECVMCDAGGFYQGKISKEGIISQIDYLVRKRYPDGVIPCKQFKIQFSRMGEPALNPEVLDVLEELPDLYDAPGLMPSLSTIAPFGTDQFFNRLLEIKNKHYSGGNFQFQFSIHTTDESKRREIVPVKTWDFEKMSAYGERFYEEGDRKVTLNFALAAGMPVDASVLHSYFSPDKFLIKITPINPTYKALDSGLSSYVDISKDKSDYKVVRDLEAFGYQVILSIGEIEENLIGSNCGQFVMRHISRPGEIAGGYTYEVEHDEILNN